MGRYYSLILLFLFNSLCSSVTYSAEQLQEYYEPGIDLPEAAGRDLILRACTRCHTLEGVPAYSKYWGYERWLPMVDNMIKHGSRLSEEEKKVVARYLATYFGTE